MKKHAASVEANDLRGDYRGSVAYVAALDGLLDLLVDVWVDDALEGRGLTAGDLPAQDVRRSGTAGRSNVTTAPNPNVKKHARAAADTSATRAPKGGA